MDVIPVIDVRHGVAVAAVRGQRANYRPLVTPLAAGSDPAAIARGYAAPVYLPAALRGRSRRHRGEGPQRRSARGNWHAPFPVRGFGSTTARPPRMLPGASPMKGMRRWSWGANALGAPTMSPRFAPCRAIATCCRSISRTTSFAGPQQVLDEAQHWPEAVIVMTLARVGSGDGPDLDRVASIVAAAGESPRLCCGRRAQPGRYRSVACEPALPACSSPRHCTPER